MLTAEILFEDNHLIAVNKPAGWLVHADETGDPTVADAVKEYIKVRYEKPGAVFLGVIHRLDRPVSGVVIFARTSKALERMNRLFQNREIEKTYWAITAQRPEALQGKLVHYIWKDKSRNLAHALDRPSRRHPDARKSVLTYKLIGELNSHCLLEVKPETGRPHQIRVQLAAIDCPIRGDLKYGFRSPNDDGNIHLHCRSLSFVHPVKKEQVTIGAEPPDDPVWNWFHQPEFR